jgi:hypothetical protein
MISLVSVLESEMGGEASIHRVCEKCILWNTCAKHVYAKNVIESFLKDIVHCKCHVKEYTVFANVICAH